MIEILFGVITFLFVSLICFTIPGLWILDIIKSTFTPWERLFLGTIIGFVGFTLLSYLLLMTGVVWLIIPSVLVSNLLIAKPLKSYIQSLKREVVSQKNILILIVIFTIGVAGQLLIIAPSGLLNPQGDLIFYSSNGHDGMWHIALMNELVKSYPWQNPDFSGEKLVNYHFFVDIVPAVFSKVSPLSKLDLYFKFLPLLFSLLLGATSFILAKRLTNSFTAGIWAVIFSYFAGSFGFIITLLRDQSIGGESIFWASQIQSSSGNPPQIASNFLVLADLIFIYEFLKGNKNLFWIVLLVSGTLIEFKVYAAFVVLISLGVTGIWRFVKERKHDLISLSIFSGILSYILYIPNSLGGSNFLIFEPWWYIRTMIVAPERLNLLDLELRRQTYIAENNLKRVLQLEIEGFLLFIIGNLGMRVVSLWELVGKIRTILSDYFSLIIITILISSLIMPLLFLQRGVASNTIQFMQYFLLLMGILSGITVSRLHLLIKSNLLLIVTYLLLITLMIPTQIGLIYSFYKNPPIAKISLDEQKVLNFISTSTDHNAVIASPPYNKYLNLRLSTPPINAWFDTSYIPALSNRRSYFVDFEQVDIMGYEYQSRLKVLKEIFEQEDPQKTVIAAKNNKIDYLYFPNYQPPQADLNKTNFRKIYSNVDAQLWKVE